MTRFSIGEAIGEPFSLMRRRPAAVFVWGLLVVGPILLFIPMMLGFMSSFAATIEAESAAGVDSATAPFPAEAFAGMVGMQAAGGLLNLLQLLAMVVVYPAVMRAVIRPDEQSWFSLRVGMDEVRVAVVSIVVFGGLYVVMMVAMMLAMVVGAMAVGLGGQHGGAAFVVVMAVFMFGMMIAALCVLARFSLMAPASLQYRTFAFSEGWRLGKGQWDRLIGLHLVSMAVILLIELLLMLVIVLVVLAAVNMGVDWNLPPAGSAENPFPAIQAILAAWWPLMVVGGVLLCALYGGLMTISVAPVASACAQLARRDEINSLTG